MLHKAGKDLLKSMRHICSGINGICRLQSERSEHENVRNENDVLVTWLFFLNRLAVLASAVRDRYSKTALSRLIVGLFNFSAPNFFSRCIHTEHIGRKIQSQMYRAPNIEDI